MNENGNLEVIEDKCFLDIIILVHDLTGITIAKNRKSMIQGRLRKRVLALGLNSYESYYDHVKSSSDEKMVFIDLVTTNETYFYRTPRIWTLIREKLLPKWYLANKGKIFYAWSAAASSGEEAHTLAILLQDFKELNADFDYQILGTDISREMVECCEKGIYQGRSVESFRANCPILFKRYLREVGPGQYSLRSNIKNRMKFHRHNLFHSLMYPNQFDLILLRNVLIYFTAEDQQKVLSAIYPKLKNTGVLVIGESESLARLQTEFFSSEPFIYHKSETKTANGDEAA